jgi:23S rRNA (uracil1939-C5)-methyltransferase
MSRRSRRPERLVETASIRDLTLDGRGIADIEGKSVFIDGAITGETVRFQRERKRKNYDEAELVEVVDASSDRVEPPCVNFMLCGGCTLQHLSPEAQLGAKQDSLLQALERIGKVTPAEVLPPLAGLPLGYRRRARLGARLVSKKGRVLVGFREKRSSYVADMNSCETLTPELSRLIPEFSELIGAMQLASQIPQIEVSMGDDATSLVFRVLEAPGEKDRELLRAFGAKNGAQIWLQTGGPDTLEPLDPAQPPDDLWYALPDFDLRLAFGPLDFVQINQDMNQRMISQAMSLVDPQPEDRVLDLFCGIGNFTLPLARHSRRVVGVELDPRMVRKAAANAAMNGLDNVEFYAANLADTVASLPEWWGGGFDLVVVDPPRAGALEVLQQIAATGAKKILYVSCHPGSLARDAGILCSEYGYRLRSAGAMDMFPATGHVEAMALFERA